MSEVTVFEDRDVKRFLQIGKLEGYSYLFLLFIAMPLKYYMNMPMAVKITGMAHGILFVSFIVYISILFSKKHLSIMNSILAVILSLIPFGTFFLKKLFP